MSGLRALSTGDEVTHWAKITAVMKSYCIYILIKEDIISQENYHTLAREFHGYWMWKHVFRTLEPTATPTNLANQVKVGHAIG